MHSSSKVKKLYVSCWVCKIHFGRPENELNLGSEATVCGICGKLNFDREARVSTALLKTMADSIYHRGPDDEG